MGQGEGIRILAHVLPGLAKGPAKGRNDLEEVGRMSLLKDANGNLSSKRIGGLSVLVVECFIAIWAAVKDPSQASNVLWPLAMTATGLLGVTIAERKK